MNYFGNSSTGLYAGGLGVKSAVIEGLEERFESGHVRIKVLLVIPPASHRRSVKRLLHVGMGRRIHALRARVLVKLQDVILEPQAQESQRRPSNGRKVVYQLLVANIHP